MNESAISVRYAKALLEAAKEAKKADQVLKDMLSLDQYFEEIPDFSVFIESPVIPVREKMAFLERISQDFEEMTLRFLQMITKNKRESFIRMMVKNYIRFYRKQQGILEAVLVTAGTVKEETVQVIRQKIKDSFQAEVELHQRTDEAIIGGFVLRIEDKQLDASVESQLKKIRRELGQTLLR